MCGVFCTLGYFSLYTPFKNRIFRFVYHPYHLHNFVSSQLFGSNDSVFESWGANYAKSEEFGQKYFREIDWQPQKNLKKS